MYTTTIDTAEADAVQLVVSHLGGHVLDANSSRFADHDAYQQQLALDITHELAWMADLDDIDW